MKNLKRMQDLALKLILFLVWFDLMCFSLILAGNIFKWSFFNESIGSAFFTMFGLSLGALASLAALHVVLTLNIISNSISTIAADKEEPDNKTNNRYKILIVASFIAIAVIVGYQGIVEHNAALYKVTSLQAKLEEIAKSTLMMKILNLIEQDAPINELYFVRDELLLSLEDQRSIVLLIPKEGQEGQVFYKITPWDYNKEDKTIVSKSLTQLFVPDKKEQAKFKELIENHAPFATVDRYDIRAFYPLVKNGKIQLILLLDTSRSIDSQYLMSRSKWGS